MLEIELKIMETQKMMAEDLRSKKFEAFESYMESKGKRKKAKGRWPKAKGRGAKGQRCRGARGQRSRGT